MASVYNEHLSKNKTIMHRKIHAKHHGLSQLAKNVYRHKELPLANILECSTSLSVRIAVSVCDVENSDVTGRNFTALLFPI